jgi:hypothetical protein
VGEAEARNVIDWTTAALWLLALQLWEMRAAFGRHRRQLRDAILWLGRDLPPVRRIELRRLLGLPALLLCMLTLAGCGWGSRREGRETVREVQRPDGAGGMVIERETVRSETAEHTLQLPAAAAVGAGIDLAATLGGAGGVAGAGALVLALLKRRQQHTTALERA